MKSQARTNPVSRAKLFGAMIIAVALFVASWHMETKTQSAREIEIAELRRPSSAPAAAADYDLQHGAEVAAQAGEAKEFEVTKTDAEWQRDLSPLSYHVTREKGNEPAFSGEYYDNKDAGKYSCIGCGNELFSSSTKYDSGTGWPNFFALLRDAAIVTAADCSTSINRTEVLCARCGAHLGHVFDDGPAPSGLRYCMNSAALIFTPEAPGGDTETEYDDTHQKTY